MTHVKISHYIYNTKDKPEFEQGHKFPRGLRSLHSLRKNIKPNPNKPQRTQNSKKLKSLRVGSTRFARSAKTTNQI